MFVFSVLEDIDSGPFMHHLHCSKKVLYIYAVGLICPEFVGLNSYKQSPHISEDMHGREYNSQRIKKPMQNTISKRGFTQEMPG